MFKRRHKFTTVCMSYSTYRSTSLPLFIELYDIPWQHLILYIESRFCSTISLSYPSNLITRGLSVPNQVTGGVPWWSFWVPRARERSVFLGHSFLNTYSNIFTILLAHNLKIIPPSQSRYITLNGICDKLTWFQFRQGIRAKYGHLRESMRAQWNPIHFRLGICRRSTEFYFLRKFCSCDHVLFSK